MKAEQEPVEAEVVEYSRRGVIRREIDPVLLPWGVSDDDYEDESLYWRLFVAVTLPRRAIREMDSMARSMRDVSYRGHAASSAIAW